MFSPLEQIHIFRPMTMDHSEVDAMLDLSTYYKHIDGLQRLTGACSLVDTKRKKRIPVVDQ